MKEGAVINLLFGFAFGFITRIEQYTQPAPIDLIGTDFFPG